MSGISIFVSFFLLDPLAYFPMHVKVKGYRIHRHICRLQLVSHTEQFFVCAVKNFEVPSVRLLLLADLCNQSASRVRVVIDPENSFPDRPFAPSSSSLVLPLLSLSNFDGDEPGAYQNSKMAALRAFIVS